MNKSLNISFFVLFLSFGLSLHADTKFNPYSGEFETVSPGSTLEFNPYSGNFEYVAPGSSLQYNSYSGNFEFGSSVEFNPYSTGYFFERPFLRLTLLREEPLSFPFMELPHLMQNLDLGLLR